MPRPRLPPTPASSSDIKGKDGLQKLSSLQLSFELPPPAIHDGLRVPPLDTTYSPNNSSRNSDSNTNTDNNIGFNTNIYAHSLKASQGQPFPMQAAEVVKARRRSSAAKDSKESAFALPPPPTRSRKIIQMKPKSQGEASESSTSKEKDTAKVAGKTSATAKSTTTAGAAGVSAGAGAGAQGKKKQPSATSAAGRKIARKTAHSLIERRRRSKMNEEFAVLKNMIPACTGEMHKLAILQASIDYVRYLEDCVSKLKAQHEENQSRGDATPNPLPPIRDFHPTFHEDPADVDMSDSDTASPVFAPQSEQARQSSVSPALLPEDSRHRQLSYSSASTDYRHYSYSTSASTSPAFGPVTYNPYAQSNASGVASTLVSPALQPQTDLDQEATAALLMLNNDRRGQSSNGRGLSVRDLLSS